VIRTRASVTVDAIGKTGAISIDDADEATVQAITYAFANQLPIDLTTMGIGVETDWMKEASLDSIEMQNDYEHTFGGSSILIRRGVRIEFHA
jgi:hypothetical protein